MKHITKSLTLSLPERAQLMTYFGPGSRSGPGGCGPGGLAAGRNCCAADALIGGKASRTGYFGPAGAGREDVAAGRRRGGPAGAIGKEKVKNE